MTAAPPFIILGLPRSRTAWISRFLSYGGRKVGHDLAIDCASVADFTKALGQHIGTVETGMAVAWPVLKRHFPESRFIVVRRDTAEVIASLAKFGISGVEREIEERAKAIDQFSRRVGVMTIQYPSLTDISVCAWLFQNCLGLNFDGGWWAALNEVNIQVDVAAQIAKTAEDKERLDRFKQEVRKRLPAEASYTGAIISAEPFGSIWPECLELAKAHWEEVESETDPRRKLNLNRALLSQTSVQNSLKVFAARLDGKLIGYLLWTIINDPESMGLLIAEQGPWFVTPDAPNSTALRMYERSINELKACGVKMIFPHHRTNGRGTGLGKFFVRRGAVPEKQVYSLWIGD